MITKELLDPKNIVVVGASKDIQKPGGKILKNLIDGHFKGELFVVNPKEIEVQGIKSYQDVNLLPNVDLAIIAIAAKFIPETVEILANRKGTRAFIIISAGFSEESKAGAELEKEIVEIVNSVKGALIGPNCTGVLTSNYQGIFTLPIPTLNPKGCDFISGSGATACFILESAIPKGLTFSSVISVGNGAQMGVEEILEHMDLHFNPEKDSKVKLLYIENVSKPQKLLQHASSLIQKGCKIAAIKAGVSEAGSRAASSHTGALASSDVVVDALFKKAGIIRCYSREELIAVASVFMYPELKGKNIAIITHAGGPAVILTDTLSNAGFNIPLIKSEKAKELLTHLYPGSSVANPIDFLATGTAAQLDTIIDYVEKEFKEIDGMIVIFGSPGLVKVFDVYDVLNKKIKTCKKPIFPVLPSILTASEEVKSFISKGQINFSDEAVLGKALAKVYCTERISNRKMLALKIDKTKIRNVIENGTDGYLEPSEIQNLLDAVDIPRVKEFVAKTKPEAIKIAKDFGYPLVMKAIGPIHKSDIGGVSLNITDKNLVEQEFDRMMKLKDVTGVLVQPMLSGTELFIGAKYEPKFGHLILCGLGGILVEVLKDVQAALCPISKEEAILMIKKLKGYRIIQGVRGKKGVNEEKFAEIICKVSALLAAAPEIVELDINPLLAKDNDIIAVDARINIKKS